MNRRQSRSRAILVAITMLLVIAVGLDRSDWLQRSDEGDGTSVRSRFFQRAALHAEQSQLLEHADQWHEAAITSSDQWSDLQRRLIVAPSFELASARFRDLIVNELRTLGVDSARATLLQQIDDSSTKDSVRTIRLEVRFDSARHQDIYAAVDRLEHLGDLLTTVSSLSIDGPGRIQMPHVISVTLEVEALAYIEASAVSDPGAEAGS